MSGARVSRTDQDVLLRDHEERLKAAERGLTDPTVWVYVSSGADWSSATAYTEGDLVEHGSPTIVYGCVSANTDVEPGVDPTWAMFWQDVGPPFEGTFTNAGGTRVPLRYRFLHTFDAKLDPDTANPDAIEIQGSVTGGAPGETIFTLLEPRYLPDGRPSWIAAPRDYDLHLPTSDDSGGFVIFTVLQSGDVVYGFV